MKNIENSNSFKKALKATEKIIEDNKRVSSVLEKAIKKLGTVKNKTKEFKENLLLTINLIKDWTKGEYREIPKKTILYMLAGIIYFLIPIDMIPDFLFKFGFLDDLAVLNFIFTSFVEDIEKYKNYKEKKIQTD